MEITDFVEVYFHLLVPLVILLASLDCVASYDVLLNTSSIWSRTFSVSSATLSGVRPLVEIFGSTVNVNLPEIIMIMIKTTRNYNTDCKLQLMLPSNVPFLHKYIYFFVVRNPGNSAG